MSTLNINNPYIDPDDAGVHNNRLIVTSKPTDFGTFAVTTAPWTDNNFPGDKVYEAIPYKKANSFRINNYTGKTIGIRRRHNSITIDNFENLEDSSWTGSVEDTSNDIDGLYSGVIKSLAHHPLTTQEMLDGSEVEVKFRTPYHDAFTVEIKVWDDPSRIGVGSPSAEFSSSSLSKNREYKIIFRLNLTDAKFDTFLESPGRSEITSQATGEFGALKMVNSVISIECTAGLTIDSIVYQQKVNFSHEQLLSPSSVVYPCEDNISEYEVINLGSNALNYSDTNINVTLSGLYTV